MSSSDMYFSKCCKGSKPLNDCPKLKHQAICLKAIWVMLSLLPGAIKDCNCSIKLLLSFTMLPHAFRASHHLSYDWLSLNDRITEIAVPKNAGIEIDIAGIWEEKLYVKKEANNAITSV